MKNEKEIREKINKLKEEIYNLKKEEDGGLLNNTEEINLCVKYALALEWVLSK